MHTITFRLLKAVCAALAAALFTGCAPRQRHVDSGVPNAEHPAIVHSNAIATNFGKWNTITIHGKERRFLCHVPTKPAGGKLCPVVLVFHGYSGSASQIAGSTNFNRVADKNGFIAVYPEGVNAQWRVPGFNLVPSITPLDDVAYVKSIVDVVTHKFHADPHRIYAAGMSNGGYFCFYLGQAMNDRIAAIAPVSGALTDVLRGQYKLAKPMPAIVFNGTADTIVPSAGRRSYNFTLCSTNDGITALTGQNGCQTKPTVKPLPDANSTDGCQAVLYTYSGKAPVQFVKIIGGGHTWPGGPSNPGDQYRFGKTCFDFDASEMIWRFFSKYRR